MVSPHQPHAVRRAQLPGRQQQHDFQPPAGWLLQQARLTASFGNRAALHRCPKWKAKQRQRPPGASVHKVAVKDVKALIAGAPRQLQQAQQVVKLPMQVANDHHLGARRRLDLQGMRLERLDDSECPAPARPGNQNPHSRAPLHAPGSAHVCSASAGPAPRVGAAWRAGPPAPPREWRRRGAPPAPGRRQGRYGRAGPAAQLMLPS